MSDTDLRIGIVGLGFGRWHAQTLAHLDGARLVAVADRRAADLNGFAGRYGATPYPDAIKMIEQAELDAVSVCVSPKARGPVLEAAATRGLAMFVEKPWAADVEQARRYAEICRASPAPVMVGFSFRFHAAVRRLRTLIDQELGPVRLASGHYVHAWLPPAGSWLWDPANGNGFINENACHLLDVVCHLLGRPTRVSAEAANFSGSPSEDTAVATLRFESDGLAALTFALASKRGMVASPRLDLVTENGKAALLGKDHIWHGSAWSSLGDTETHRLRAPPEAASATRYTDAWRHFLDCVRDSASPSAPIEDGVRGVELAAAIGRAVRTGRAVEINTPT